MNKSEMTQAQRDVLAVYPDAYAYQWSTYHDGETGITIRSNRGNVAYGRLGFGETDAEAWADAASKLPAPPIQQKSAAQVAEQFGKSMLSNLRRNVAKEKASQALPLKNAPDSAPGGPEISISVEGQAGEAREPEQNLDEMCSCGHIAEYHSGGYGDCMTPEGCDCRSFAAPPGDQHGVKMPPRPDFMSKAHASGWVYDQVQADAYMGTQQTPVTHRTWPASAR